MKVTLEIYKEYDTYILISDGMVVLEVETKEQVLEYVASRLENRENENQLNLF